MKYSMKIGVLIKEFENLSNWELRIIQEIINDPKLELTLLIQDGRIENESQKTIRSKFSRLISSKNILGKLIFKLQVLIEKKIFFKEIHTVDKGNIISYLNSITTVKIKPKRKGFIDFFSVEDSKKIKKYKLDIILRHEFGIISGEILNSAKYGIWSFHHADNSINRGGPAGFWEIIFKQQSVGVTLQQLTTELDGGLVIDKAYFNRHWSFVKTNNTILEASVSVLFKNIRKLDRGFYSATKSMVYYNPLYKSPSLYYAIKYISSFYIVLTKKIIRWLFALLFGIRYGCWTLFIGKGDFLNSTLFRLKPIELPKDVFWADPFLFQHNNECYIFFENYSYKTKRGKISCGRINNNKIIDVVDALDLNYHLSYPFIFKEDGEIYLMPETAENKRLEIYRCTKFPNKWVLYSTAFDGEKIFDAFFFNDKQKQKWLFVNKQVASTTLSNSELYIYKVASLKLNNLQSHTQNPVIINSLTARNGGAIFEYDNNLHRPSQANIHGIYGSALNINKIEKLTINEYVEKNIITVEPNFLKGLISMHHLHQIDGMFVFDAAFKKR